MKLVDTLKSCVHLQQMYIQHTKKSYKTSAALVGGTKIVTCVCSAGFVFDGVRTDSVPFPPGNVRATQCSSLTPVASG